MSTNVELRDQHVPVAAPAWLHAAAQPVRVHSALARSIPAFATGELELEACEIRSADAAPARHGSDLVVAKVYHGDTGQNAYAGMRALWNSPLATSEKVCIRAARQRLIVRHSSPE